MLVLFAITLGVSAALLFSVQPLAAKLLLPLLGGSPSVWNTCMVFFQGLLLAGYGYAHFVTGRLSLRAQGMVQLGMLGLGGLLLPIRITEEWVGRLPSSDDPTVWLLGCLLSTVGLPFFILSTSAPLLQRWFSGTKHRSASDPYFLYAASNLGSLLALLAYPVIVEPSLRLGSQSEAWAWVYAGFVLLVVLCFLWALNQVADGAKRSSSAGVSLDRVGVAATESLAQVFNPVQSEERVGLSQRFEWVLASFIPSSLMLAVTTYLTTDIASIPLLWIVPLGLYLATFIVAFASIGGKGGERVAVGPALERWLRPALPAGCVAMIFLLVGEATQPAWLILTLHLVFFFMASLVCHGKLARKRPAVAHLTEYYLWISVGGVLGGMFNALMAPNIFNRVTEYPMVILLASLMRPGMRTEGVPWKWRWVDLVGPLGIGGLTAWLARHEPWPMSVQLRIALIFGVPLVLAYTLVDRRMRFALGLGAVVWASAFYAGPHGRTLHAERNFFGVLRVTLDPSGQAHRLVHGNTVHGTQFLAAEKRNEPLAYYHQTGPLGDVFKAFNAKTNSARVGVVGLGTGSILSYAQPHQHWVYYEIDPAVLRVARDTNYFTFIERTRVGKLDFVLGDARLQLRSAPDGSFDLLILDAFSSDAIPVHLLTREAFELYLKKLAPGGLLAFHISNRCLDLEPVVGDLAAEAGLVCHAHEEIAVSSLEEEQGKQASHWIVMARDRPSLGRLARDGRWLPVKGRQNAKVWSDDYSNLLGAFKWD